MSVPRNLFPRLGLVDFAAGDGWNLIAQAQSLGFWLVSPAEGTSALAQVVFFSISLQACTRMDRL